MGLIRSVMIKCIFLNVLFLIFYQSHYKGMQIFHYTILPFHAHFGGTRGPLQTQHTTSTSMHNSLNLLQNKNNPFFLHTELSLSVQQQNHELKSHVILCSPACSRLASISKPDILVVCMIRYVSAQIEVVQYQILRYVYVTFWNENGMS